MRVQVLLGVSFPPDERRGTRLVLGKYLNYPHCTFPINFQCIHIAFNMPECIRLQYSYMAKIYAISTMRLATLITPRRACVKWGQSVSQSVNTMKYLLNSRFIPIAASLCGTHLDNHTLGAQFPKLSFRGIKAV